MFIWLVSIGAEMDLHGIIDKISYKQDQLIDACMRLLKKRDVMETFSTFWQPVNCSCKVPGMRGLDVFFVLAEQTVEQTIDVPGISDALTHWGRLMHICVSKLNIIGSDNGLSPGRRQAIIWTNAGILLIGF